MGPEGGGLEIAKRGAGMYKKPRNLTLSDKISKK